MKVATSHSKAIHELAKALGVPPGTIEFTLNVKPNACVTLTIIHFLDESNICSLTETIKKSELKEKE